MISALKQLVASSSQPLHLYWSFRDSAKSHPFAMMQFNIQGLPSQHYVYTQLLRQAHWLASLRR